MSNIKVIGSLVSVYQESIKAMVIYENYLILSLPDINYIVRYLVLSIATAAPIVNQIRFAIPTLSAKSYQSNNASDERTQVIHDKLPGVPSPSALGVWRSPTDTLVESQKSSLPATGPNTTRRSEIESLKAQRDFQLLALKLTPEIKKSIDSLIKTGIKRHDFDRILKFIERNFLSRTDRSELKPWRDQITRED
jgi:hypothetical protein